MVCLGTEVLTTEGKNDETALGLSLDKRQNLCFSRYLFSFYSSHIQFCLTNEELGLFVEAFRPEIMFTRVKHNS